MRNEEENNININEINNINRRSLFQSVIAEANPIVIQLIEFGYNPIYSRRVFHYLHPEDLEEALNYMSVDNGIIQHHFLQNNRNMTDQLCYICNENKENHLGQNFINNNESNNNNIEVVINNNNNNININNISEINNNGSDMLGNLDIKNSDISINKSKNANIESQKSSSVNELNTNEINLSFKLKENLNKNENNDINKENEKSECEICGDKYIINFSNKLEKCGHSFCDSCWFDFLSVKINENKLSSIKCLDYNCEEKLNDEFIINLLNKDNNLIKKYKRYKLELEIINNPNKKLCPYPNCDSYLELKEKRNKDVKCLNNHNYCFICLKKPHGKLSCDKDNIDKDIKEYAKNNFIKKCPKCSIITEKNAGCNHITCTKCGYQWCWLCNEKYTENHFKEGKCKGFQFFQPKNDYDIKLIMEGKINSNELSNSQIQFDMPHFEDEDNDFPRRRIRPHHLRDVNVNFPRIRIDENERINREYSNISIKAKIFIIIFYIFFGHIFLIFLLVKENFHYFRIKLFLFSIYVIFNISFFFQLLLINIIMFFLILIIYGFKKFIIGVVLNNYIKNFILVINYLLIGSFIVTFYFWKEKTKNIRKSNVEKIITSLTFFSCSFMTLIILLPQHIILNIIYIFILLLKNGNFRELNSGIEETFGVRF